VAFEDIPVTNILKSDIVRGFNIKSYLILDGNNFKGTEGKAFFLTPFSDRIWYIGLIAVQNPVGYNKYTTK